jgi:hypothetical protein
MGSTTTGTAGSSASVSNSGNGSAAVLNFTIPKGDTGTAATVAVGSVSTGAAGSSASVTNAGNSGAAIFNFTIPQGTKGDTGSTGPNGDKGDTGNTGPQGLPVNFIGAWVSGGPYIVGNAVAYNGSSYIAIAANSSTTNPATDVGAGVIGTNWALLAKQGATGTIGAVANYSAGASYSTGQVVFCAGACTTNGSSYISLAASNQGYDPPTSNSKWTMIAEAGTNGAPGTPGTAGATPTIQIGTVSTVPYASGASVNASGTNPVTLNFSIPSGQTGAAGTVQSLSTSVTNSGSTGTASFSGTTNPVLTINFPASSGGVTSAQAVAAAQTAAAYGSGSGGALVISSSEDWTGATLPSDANNGILQFTSITVNSGATWKIPSGLTFLSTGAVNINGTILVEPSTASGSPYGTVIGNAATSALYCTTVTTCLTSSALSEVTLATLLYPGHFGGGQGFPEGINSGLGTVVGGGGGSLVIRAAGAITIGSTGQITANGGNGIGITSGLTSIGGSGGGGGGILILASQSGITNNGTLSAAGGNGGNGYQAGGSTYAYAGGGGGGGGLIHLLAPSISAGTSGTNTDVAGGTAGSVSGSNSGNGASGGSGGAMGGAGGVAGMYSSVYAASGSAGLLFETTVDPTSLFTH